MMGEQFVGTSNTWMAFKYDLIPIGTNAHELPMVMTALADSKEGRLYAQYRVLELWQEIYGQGLRVFLPDTYGTKQFLDNAPAWVATWRGMRQDSGDPIVALEQYCDWLQKHGVDPLERLGIPSDGLNVAMEGEGMENDMIRLSKNFIGRLPALVRVGDVRYERLLRLSYGRRKFSSVLDGLQSRRGQRQAVREALG